MHRIFNYYETYHLSEQLGGTLERVESMRSIDLIVVREHENIDIKKYIKLNKKVTSFEILGYYNE